MKKNIFLNLIKGAAKTFSAGALGLGLAFFESTGIDDHIDSQLLSMEVYMDQTQLYKLDSQEEIINELKDAGFHTTFYKSSIKSIVKDLKNRDYRNEKINLKK